MTLQERINVLRSHGHTPQAVAAILNIAQADVHSLELDPDAEVTGPEVNVDEILQTVQALLEGGGLQLYIIPPNPPDPDQPATTIAASQGTLWLDDTEGEPTVHFTAKDSEGGVFTASIPLIAV